MHLEVEPALSLYSSRFFFSIYSRQLLCAGFALLKFADSALALVAEEGAKCLLSSRYFTIVQVYSFSVFVNCYSLSQACS